jgi:hypothetical protein
MTQKETLITLIEHQDEEMIIIMEAETQLPNILILLQPILWPQ